MAAIIEKRNLCGLIIDATIEESHSVSSRVTDHPVSTGSPISDHVYREPLRLTLRGVIGATAPKDYFSQDRRPRNSTSSNAPIFRDFNGDQGETIRLFGVNNFGSTLSTIDYSQANGRISAAWCRLIELQDNKEVCEVVTGLKVYDNMVVENVEATQNSDNCEKLDFTVRLKQVRRVTAVETNITPIENSSKGAVDTGKKEPRCLRLDQVFVDKARQSDTPFGSRDDGIRISVDGSIERLGEQGVYSPFHKEIWQSQICGAIQERFRVNTLYEVQETQFGPINPYSIGANNSISNTPVFGIDPNNLETFGTFSTSACEVIYRSSSCAYSKACGETNYQGNIAQSEENDVEELRNVENSSSTTDLTDQQRLRQRQEEELRLQSDPTGQLFSLVNTSRNAFSAASRITCYQEQILSFLENAEFTEGDLDDFLRLVASGQVPPVFPDFNTIPSAPPPIITQ